MRFFNFHKKENILKIVEHTHLFKRYFYLVIGVLIYAISYNLFFLKNNIVFGGVSGVSIITKDIITPAIMIAILSAILLIVSWILLGKKQTLNTIVGTILFPIFVALTKDIGTYIQLDNDNLLLIAIIGGVCVGFGSGLVFKTGFTLGGTDILNQVLSKYLKISIGTSMLFSDGLIVLAGGFFFGWTKSLYAIIVLYIISIMVDKVVLGIASTKALYITTLKDDEISNYLLEELGLGVTLIETRGGYTNKRKQMIMSVVSTSDYFRVRAGIQEIDPNAIIIATDAYQSVGTYGSKKGEE